MTYILQTTLVFSLLYFVYLALLEKRTFHQYNRLVLILLIPVSLGIPFLATYQPLALADPLPIPAFELESFEQSASQVNMIPETETSFSLLNLILLAYALGCLISFIRLLRQINHFEQLKRSSESLQIANQQIYISPNTAIFSYFNSIFFPTKELALKETEILAHEQMHVRLKHAWDILLSELFLVFFWFNPLSYQYRKSLKAVHEFQVDEMLLEEGTELIEYLELLQQNLQLKSPNYLCNYFSQSLLKKRVHMMLKKPSNSYAKLRYFAFFPLGALLFSGFTSPNESIIPQKIAENRVSNSADIPSLFPVQGMNTKAITSGFGKRLNPESKKQQVHGGIDIKAKPGTAVYATADGLVAKANEEGNWGNLIVIQHGNGFETWYAHLADFNTEAEQTVKKGDIIGYVGNTGLSKGAHLHYEVKQNGTRLDPMNFFE